MRTSTTLVRSAVFLLLITMWLPCTVRAADPMTCAVLADPALGLPDSAAVHLLEVDLSKKANLALLERAEIQKILGEQKLQLALTAQGLDERRRLGALLKARLLVIMRATDATIDGKPRRQVECVISETSQGLRLSREVFVLDESTPQAAVDQISALVDEAMIKAAQPALAILAVPPFVSGDLLHDYDAMQDAYAQCVITDLMRTPGLRVVELAEAQAIAQEIRLGQNQKIGRELLPYYLNGTFRDSVQGQAQAEARKVSLTLEIRQGDQPILSKQSEPLAPEAAALFLRETAAAALQQALKQPPQAFDAAAESLQLERRAGQSSLLGDWATALSLDEAALLIDPERVSIHRHAIQMLTKQMWAAGRPSYLPLDAPQREKVLKLLALDDRACTHFAYYLAHFDADAPRLNLPDRPDFSTLYGLFWFAVNSQNMPVKDPEIKQAMLIDARRKRELFLAACDGVLAQGTHDSRAITRLNTGRTLSGNALEISHGTSFNLPIEESDEELAAARWREIRAWADMRDGARVYMVLHCLTDGGTSTTAFQKLIDQTAALNGPEWPYIAKVARVQLLSETPEKELAALGALKNEVSSSTLPNDLKRYLDSNLQNGIGTAKQKIERVAIDIKINKDLADYKAGRLTPINAPTPTPAPSSSDDFVIQPIPEIKTQILGWIKGSPAFDILWDAQTIYIMRRPGQPAAVCHVNPMPGGAQFLPGAVEADEPEWAKTSIVSQQRDVAQVIYDGRYLWSAFKDKICVIDPDSLHVEEIGAANGLPPGRIRLAPLSPGHVCAVGGFGRSWIANVDFAADGAKKVDVFHEARLEAGNKKDLGLTFNPYYAVTLRGAKPEDPPRVLIGRARNDSATYFPLLVDPAHRTVSVLDERLSNELRPESLFTNEGKVYWIESSIDNSAPTEFMEGSHTAIYHLAQFGAPDFHKSLPLSRIAYLGFPARYGVPRGMLGFADGECFLFLDDCWLADPKRGRSVQLRGHLPGERSTRRAGESNFYGIVLMTSEGMSGASYQFQPAAAFKSSLTAIHQGDAAGRKTIAADPFEGKKVTVQIAGGSGAMPQGMPNTRGAAAPQPISVEGVINSGTVMVERDGLPANPQLTLDTAIQADAAFKGAGAGVLTSRFGAHRSGRDPNDPLFFEVQLAAPVPGEGASQPPSRVAGNK